MENLTEQQDGVAPSLSATLLILLEADPNNPELLADAAEAAIDERDADLAKQLLERYRAAGGDGNREANLSALVALQTRDFAHAAQALEKLPLNGPEAVGVRFNLAWARANLDDPAGALEVLDGESGRMLPQAAALHIRLLHTAGQLNDAAALIPDYLAAHPGHRDLLAAVSVLAIDLEDTALARRCAEEAGDQPEALSTMGTLALGSERATDALVLFERALAHSEAQPRAWIGRGLAKLLTGEEKEAAADIDRGAQMFGTHLGSWIAAGWAHFIRGDRATSRERFETALSIDPNFAESHGSLAVLAILDGDFDLARRESDVALRLDRECYSAALAQTMLAASEGDAATAERIFTRAISTPVDGGGRTIGMALAAMGLGPSSGLSSG